MRREGPLDTVTRTYQWKSASQVQSTRTLEQHDGGKIVCRLKLDLALSLKNSMKVGTWKYGRNLLEDSKLVHSGQWFQPSTLIKVAWITPFCASVVVNIDCWWPHRSSEDSFMPIVFDNFVLMNVTFDDEQPGKEERMKFCGHQRQDLAGLWS